MIGILLESPNIKQRLLDVRLIFFMLSCAFDIFYVIVCIG